MPCKGRNAKGEPCRAVEHLLDADGLCPAHRPGGRERMAEIGRKGAAASHERFKRTGLDPDELGRLKSPEDARRYLEIVSHAVASGRLPNRDGAVVVRSVEAFLKAHDVGEMAERIRDLEARLQKLQRARVA